MGQIKGNLVRLNENRDTGTKPLMVDDTETINQVVNSIDKISVDQIESIGNLDVTGSLGTKLITINGSTQYGNSGDISGIAFYGDGNGSGNGPHRIYNNLQGELVHFTRNDVHFTLGSDYELPRPKLYISGSFVVNGTDSTIQLPNHSSAPSLPASGALYFNTTNFHFYGWNGNVWKQLDN